MRRTLAALALPIAAVLGAGLLSPAPALAEKWPGHPGRTIVHHTVRSGDTATGLAVRYHAWTAELLRLNHLRPSSVLHIGEHLRIPVVDKALRKKRHHAHPKKHHAKHQTRHKKHHATHHHKKKLPAWMVKLRRHGWSHFGHTRQQVKRQIGREARRQGVRPSLAQAVGWMESGWRQPVVSSAGAIGIMQVLPSTGVWMSMYAGRSLDVRNGHDNIRAGVTLLKVLGDHTRTTRQQVGAYYQGLGAVQRHGLYQETRRYVATVLAIERRLRR